MNPNDLDIENRFTYHQPTAAKSDIHSAIRNYCKSIAYLFSDLLPDSREKSLATTKLEEAMFWANAAVARNV